jgi:VWFA-related protein
MRHFIPALVCATLCFTRTFAQQVQPPPGQPAVTFKAEVNYVDVDTVVTDQQGNFVKGLTRNDFELLEDGKPQKVEMFSYVDLPLERPQRLVFRNRPVVNDVKSNQQSLAGRMYVLVLDDLDTSLFRAATVKRTARQFIERYLGPNDVAAVVYTSGRGDASQEFTSDQQLLLAAADKFVGRKLRSSMLDKIDQQYNQAEQSAMAAASGAAASTNSGALSPGSSTDPSINPFTRGDGYPDRTFDSDDLERGHRALGVLNELKNLADFMGSVHGRRKALVLFSEGIDYATDDIFGAQEATTVVKAMQDAITAAARGNVSIFGIDPRGLVGMSADAISLDSPGAPGDAPTSSANLAGFSAEMRLSQNSLRSLSEETGGFSSLGNDPATFFDRLVKANSTYYVLGYYPPNHPRDGRFHKIDVRVKRPALKVSARKGYADPRGKTPEERANDERDRLAREAKKGGADQTTAELRAVLNSPMQQAGVAMLVQAAPFKAAPKEHTVALAIEMDSAPFHFESQNNGAAFADKIELSYFSLNEQGKPLRGERRELDLSLRPDTYQRARQAGLRINERLALAPGRYQLRIGVRENGTGALGTVFYDLQVPDFASEPLSVSGMLLTAATSPAVPTLIPDKLIRGDLLPGPATSRRTFAQGDELALYAEIYDNLPAAQNQTVAVTTLLLNEAGREVFTSRETLQGAQKGNVATTTFGVSKRISLKDVAPGQYLLRVEAQTSGNPKDAKSAARETVVTVIPAGK